MSDPTFDQISDFKYVLQKRLRQLLDKLEDPAISLTFQKELYRNRHRHDELRKLLQNLISQLRLRIRRITSKRCNYVDMSSYNYFARDVEDALSKCIVTFREACLPIKENRLYNRIYRVWKRVETDILAYVRRFSDDGIFPMHGSEQRFRQEKVLEYIHHG